MALRCEAPILFVGRRQIKDVEVKWSYFYEVPTSTLSISIPTSTSLLALDQLEPDTENLLKYRIILNAPDFALRPPFVLPSCVFLLVRTYHPSILIDCLVSKPPSRRTYTSNPFNLVFLSSFACKYALLLLNFHAFQPSKLFSLPASVTMHPSLLPYAALLLLLSSPHLAHAWGAAFYRWENCGEDDPPEPPTDPQQYVAYDGTGVSACTVIGLIAGDDCTYWTKDGHDGPYACTAAFSQTGSIG